MPPSKLPPAPLESDLEALYATFSRYDGAHLEGCPHCVSSRDSAALHRAPVRLLGGELQHCLFNAMTTWGTEEDFKHFVPRLLELYASSADAWLLCDKLAYARWRSWAGPEQRAVESYLLSLWRAELAEHGPPLPGDALFETMLTFDRDIAPYDLRTKLDAWRSEGSRETLGRLVHFVLEHGVELFWASPSVGRPTLWKARPDMAAEVRAWLLERKSSPRRVSTPPPARACDALTHAPHPAAHSRRAFKPSRDAARAHRHT